MSNDGHLSKRRLRNAAIGAIVGFIIAFAIFAGFELVGILVSGSGMAFGYSLWAALFVGVISFFSIAFLTPRKYLGPSSEVAADDKVDSRVETTVEAMEKDGEGHFHVKGERKEEDVLKRLEESHEPRDKQKNESQD